MILRFLSATGIYAVIDIGWNVSPLARGMYARLHAASGNDWSFGKTPDTWGAAELVAVVVFFLLIGYGNSRLAIEPANRGGEAEHGGEEQPGARPGGVCDVHRADVHRDCKLAGCAGADRHRDWRRAEPGHVDDSDHDLPATIGCQGDVSQSGARSDMRLAPHFGKPPRRSIL